MAPARDETHKMLKASGVWGEKTLYRGTHGDRPDRLAGRPARGRTARIWLRVEGHGARIIRWKLTVLPRIGAS